MPGELLFRRATDGFSFDIAGFVHDPDGLPVRIDSRGRAPESQDAWVKHLAQLCSMWKAYPTAIHAQAPNQTVINHVSNIGRNIGRSQFTPSTRWPPSNVDYHRKGIAKCKSPGLCVGLIIGRDK